MSREISPTGKRSGPGSSPELRAPHADRDRVVERVAAGDGPADLRRVGRALEAVLSAQTVSELADRVPPFYRPPAGACGRTSGARAWRNFSADLLRPHHPRFAELLAGDERSLARLDADIDLDARA